MDNWTTAVYVRELVHQAEAAQLAAQEFNASLKSPGANGTARAFAAVQSLLAAAAMVSKMLWPKPSKFRFDGSPLKEAEEAQRKTTLDRGRTLRTALGIKGSTLVESRKVRNALEHFDDRLDRYFEAGHRMVVDRNIGPKNRLAVIGDKPALHLRLIDTEAGTVSVLEDEVPIQGLFDAIVDVSNRAQGWLTEHGQ